MDESDDIDSLVDWQMGGLENRKAPTVSNTLFINVYCPKCRCEWHGLERLGCSGAFDTPPVENNSTDSGN